MTSDKLLLSRLTAVPPVLHLPFQVLSPCLPILLWALGGDFFVCFLSTSLGLLYPLANGDAIRMLEGQRKERLECLFSFLSLLAWLLFQRPLNPCRQTSSISKLQLQLSQGSRNGSLPVPRGKGGGEMETTLLLTQEYLTNPCSFLLTVFSS